MSVLGLVATAFSWGDTALGSCPLSPWAGKFLGLRCSLFHLLRYQSGQLNSSKAMEMLELNGNEEERVIMNPIVTAASAQQKETLSLAKLFNPPGDIPTRMSGRIVYVCVSVIGE